jgi:hypothetical protein
LIDNSLLLLIVGIVIVIVGSMAVGFAKVLPHRRRILSTHEVVTVSRAKLVSLFVLGSFLWFLDLSLFVGNTRAGIALVVANMLFTLPAIIFSWKPATDAKGTSKAICNYALGAGLVNILALMLTWFLY